MSLGVRPRLFFRFAFAWFCQAQGKAASAVQDCDAIQSARQNCEADTEDAVMTRLRTEAKLITRSSVRLQRFARVKGEAQTEGNF